MQICRFHRTTAGERSVQLYLWAQLIIIWLHFAQISQWWGNRDWIGDWSRKHLTAWLSVEPSAKSKFRWGTFWSATKEVTDEFLIRELWLARYSVCSVTDCEAGTVMFKGQGSRWKWFLTGGSHCSQTLMRISPKRHGRQNISSEKRLDYIQDLLPMKTKEFKWSRNSLLIFYWSKKYKPSNAIKYQLSVKLFLTRVHIAQRVHMRVNPECIHSDGKRCSPMCCKTLTFFGLEFASKHFDKLVFISSLFFDSW